MTHERARTWWDARYEGRVAEFSTMVGDASAASRAAVRSHVIGRGYGTVLDVGCGAAVDYSGYRADGSSIAYAGVDVSRVLVEDAVARGLDVRPGSADLLPAGDASCDVVTVRHLLEHMGDYRAALREAVRVARAEVVVTFFRPPGSAPDVRNYDPVEHLYNNVYNRSALEGFVRALPRVAAFRWLAVDRDEVLFISLSA